MSSGRLRRIARTAAFRLTLAYAGLFVVSAGVLFAAVYWIATAALQADMTAVLRTEALQLSEIHARAGLRGLVPEIARRMSFRARGPIYYLLQAPTRDVIIGNLPGMVPREGVLDLQRNLNEPDRGPEELNLTGFGLRLRDGTFLVVAQDTARVRDMQRAIIRAFAWAGGLTLLLAIAGGAVLAVNFLRRIDQISRTSRAIMEGDLTARIPARGTDDEIDQLVVNLNAMLDRVQGLMIGLRQVSSDIAHDLRTPLGRLRQHLEEARDSARTTEAYAAATEAAIAEADALLETFSALLRIAQIEAGVRRSAFAAVDLSAVLRGVGEAYVASAEESGHTLRLEIEDGIGVTGDRQLLSLLASNLIENALHHTPAGTTIRLVLRRAGDGFALHVIDNGPGIPAEERDKVVDRFYRLDRSRSTPGSGLGLAMVKAIASLHGLSLAFLDAGPGLDVLLTKQAGPPERHEP
jgi:signal transduction histidine kinase